MSTAFDLAVVGGGIMGAATGLRAAAGGMRVVLCEAGTIGSGASGVNAGTLSLQIKRVALMPYALRGHEIWARTGDAVGFHRTGGLTLAFTKAEAALLTERMVLKREAGAPIDLITTKQALAIEPSLTQKVVAASWCAEDGHADSSLTGHYYRRRLAEAGVVAHEFSAVRLIEQRAAGFRLQTEIQTIDATRVLLATGAWLRATGHLLGLELPVTARVNTVSVTERAPRFFSAAIGHATGLLTMKQKDNGTVLIGGGWQGVGQPDLGRGAVDVSTLIPNLRLAQFAAPALKSLRLVRSWTGYEAHAPDFYPLAGPAPGLPGVFVLGCVRGGYTIGPYIGELMGDLILGRVPERALFDLGRFGEPQLETQST